MWIDLECTGSMRGRVASVSSLVLTRLPLYLASLFISLVFLLVNLTCAVLVKTGTWERKGIVSVRVAINDSLFVLCAVSLSICLYKISKMSLANIYLESKVRWTCGRDPAGSPWFSEEFPGLRTELNQCLSHLTPCE